MKKIQLKYLKLSWVFATLGVISLSIGVFYWPLFISSVICIALVVYINITKLKCPYCRGFENIDRLTYAKNHEYHCRHCGQIIKFADKE